MGFVLSLSSIVALFGVLKSATTIKDLVSFALLWCLGAFFYSMLLSFLDRRARGMLAQLAAWFGVPFYWVLFCWQLAMLFIF